MIRIQRSRKKGYKTPPNTIYVGRPTKYGNPYTVKDYMLSLTPNPNDEEEDFHTWATNAYRQYLERNPKLIELAKKELKGKNLSCFCSLDKDCHVDVLLEIANK